MTWASDTIASRFAGATLLALLAGAGLTWLSFEVSGVWALPSLDRSGLIGQARDITRLIEASSSSERPMLAEVAGKDNPFTVNWYSADSTVAVALNIAAEHGQIQDYEARELGAPSRRILHFDADRPAPQVLKSPLSQSSKSTVQLFALSLVDNSWIVFEAPRPLWSLPSQARLGIGLSFLLLSIAVVTTAATLQLSRPIRRFTEALQRFGVDPRAFPLEESGPAELRLTIAAFNATQMQVQRFVEDRTIMLAAISHDLRTPLTKMRLRGELIDDPEQRLKLFRDVDDMQAMINSALSFFRESMDDEETTRFDLSELIRTIADDFADHGNMVPYDGPPHLTFFGRPLALKRAFTNLTENGVKYGKAAQVQLRSTTRMVTVLVTDEGPGIADHEQDKVFTPFFRLEGSRNRTTGGVGLGLTSARAIVRAHGGDIFLRNMKEGGLVVEVALPLH